MCRDNQMNVSIIQAGPLNHFNDPWTRSGLEYFCAPLLRKGFSIDKLKDMTFAMFSMQWHYFYSAVEKALEVFKAFYEAVYYLLTFNMPQAKSCAYKAGSSIAGSLLDLTLAVAWACLTVLRFSSFIASLVFCSHGAILGEYMDRETRKQRRTLIVDVSQAQKELRVAYAEAMLECDNVRIKIDEYFLTIEDLSQSSSSSPRQDNPSNVPRSNVSNVLFQQKRQTTPIAADYIVRKELLRQLRHALKSYPAYDSKRELDVHYVREIHRRLEEHHIQTMNIAQILIDKYDEALFHIRETYR